MCGGKNVENRKQMWSYRGPLVIHAAGKVSERGQRSHMVTAAWAEHRHRHSCTMPLGVILGVVDLVDCHRATGTCCGPWADQPYRPWDTLELVTPTHLVLANPRLLTEPIPWRGQLGLWTLPADVLTERSFL
jgi:hypothetical protein